MPKIKITDRELLDIPPEKLTFANRINHLNNILTYNQSKLKDNIAVPVSLDEKAIHNLYTNLN